MFVWIDESVHSVLQEIAVKKRKRRSASGRDFARNFRFDDGEDEADIDHLDGIRRYLKSSVPSTLQEKIDEERRALKIDEKVRISGDNKNECACRFCRFNLAAILKTN